MAVRRSLHRLLLGFGMLRCSCHLFQNGIPHLQFQQLILHRIAVSQNVQPQRIPTHAGTHGLVPRSRRSKYNGQQQAAGAAPFQNLAGPWRDSPGRW